MSPPNWGDHPAFRASTGIACLRFSVATVDAPAFELAGWRRGLHRVVVRTRPRARNRRRVLRLGSAASDPGRRETSWWAVAALVVLLVSCTAVGLGGCASQELPTPLPSDVTITAPDTSMVPTGVAAYSGIWTGRWAHSNWSGAGGNYQTLVVQRIWPAQGGTAYRVRVLLSWGQYGNSTPGYNSMLGTVSRDGVLRLDRFADGGQTSFSLSNDHRMLTSEYIGPRGSGRGQLWRRDIFAE